MEIDNKGTRAVGQETLRPSQEMFGSIPELMLSIDVEGDWASYVHDTDQAEAALLAAAEERYRARMQADQTTMGPSVSSAPGSLEVNHNSETDTEDEHEDVDPTLAAFQRRVGVWPEQVGAPAIYCLRRPYN
eukprot:scaffold124978_cov33-Tisochrysis_lutea.AAC.1